MDSIRITEASTQRMYAIILTMGYSVKFHHLFIPYFGIFYLPNLIGGDGYPLPILRRYQLIDIMHDLGWFQSFIRIVNAQYAFSSRSISHNTQYIVYSHIKGRSFLGAFHQVMLLPAAINSNLVAKHSQRAKICYSIRR